MVFRRAGNPGAAFFMSPFSIHATDLADYQAELGDDCPVMWYSGGPIKILPGGATYKTKNSQGGLSINADLSLTVIAADFGAGFDFNDLTSQQFNYPGETGQLYSVDSIVKVAGGLQVRILANSSAEGL